MKSAAQYAIDRIRQMAPPTGDARRAMMDERLSPMAAQMTTPNDPLLDFYSVLLNERGADGQRPLGPTMPEQMAEINALMPRDGNTTQNLMAGAESFMDSGIAPGFGMMGTVGKAGGVLDTAAIRPSTDDAFQVASAQFNTPRVLGNEIVDVSSLRGGVRLSDPTEAARVKQLAGAMQTDDGYISRLIVDAEGNVVEGQHRLEALRDIGVSQAPVTRIADGLDGLPVDSMDQAMRALGGIHSTHRRQIIEQISEMLADVGTPSAVRNEYQFPKGFEQYFDAALRAMEAGQ